MPKPGPSPSRMTAAASSNRRLGGNAKLQWKVDWAARWVALGVDYEMAGKDLIDSVIQSSKIARALGGRPPEGFNYEMFLDEQGEKISKSKGNGLSLDEWLRYGSEESLAFLHLPRAAEGQEPAHRRHPARGRRILAVPREICRAADRAEARQPGPPHPRRQGSGDDAAADLRAAAQPRQPARRRRQGDRLEVRPALRARHLGRERSRARPADRPRGQLRARFRRPRTSSGGRPRRRKPAALRDLDSELAGLPGDADAEAIQHIVFEVGKRHPFEVAAPLVPGALRNPARLEPRGRAWAASSRSTASTTAAA